MKRFTLALAAVVAMTMMGTQVAQAKAPKNGPKQAGTSSSSSFIKTMGNKNFHCYNRSYCGWCNYCWYPTYGCYGYYCPQQCSWFYWYQPWHCYLPTTYLTQYAPTTPGLTI